MKIKGLVWFVTRTGQFGPMLAFCRDVMGLAPVYLEPGFAALDMPTAARFEIFGADSPYNTFLTRPVAGFLVDDITAARAKMEALGVEFIEPTHTEADGNAWCYFRAPDGFLYSLAVVPGHPAN